MRRENQPAVSGIAYAPANGERGQGDLWLPENPAGAPAALVIHGGGWRSMDRHSLEPFARLLAECGYGVFNAGYRLIGQAPWPACGDDCLGAARFVLEAEHEALKVLDRSQLLVLGASAGGHLALMTGLRLPPERVRGIVSIAGPTDLILWADGAKSSLSAAEFCGDPAAGRAELAAASPINLVGPDSPPLWCLHSVNDRLVPPEHSEKIVARYRAVGVEAELATFSGPGQAHGIWTDGGGEKALSDRVILPQAAELVRAQVRRWASNSR